MRVPRWVNVVLEGGGFELEKAYARYRELRRLLPAGWSPKASEVCQVSGLICAAEEAVEEAVSRADRRVAQDPGAQAVRDLGDAVRRERGALLRILDERFPRAAEREGLVAKLAVCQEVAREERYLDRSWRRFQLERRVITMGTLGVAGLPPLGFWWVASAGGHVPTLIDVHLFDTPATLAALAAGGLWLLASVLRAASWQWLGVRIRSGAAAAFTGLGVFLGSALGGASPATAIGFGFLGGMVLTAAQLLHSLWRAPASAPADVC